ncbi:hypothetical protein SAY86_028488 [Trapa natans]|uniref:Cyclin D3 n=1 Tax=Trapa natans TaxID=22666 RepID=A0AAN7MCZ6_TRANT|nr:hypothetical protein SAY86_028488 [Trapa natans]
MEDDLSWEDDELTHMLSSQSRPEIRPEMSPFRRGAVDLVLELHGHCGFSSITAVLAVDYLDRFLSSGCTSQQNTAPWQGHLTAAVCLSLAAKVVETAVPLLPDLQGDEGAYFFDAKTMKRMELLVLSRLKWRMNPVTPLSFLDHISRRLHFRDPRLCGEFLRMYECLLLSVLSDIGLLQFPPSVVAAATTLQVIGGLENAGLGEECLSDLLGILANDRKIWSPVASLSRNTCPRRRLAPSALSLVQTNGITSEGWWAVPA